MDQVPVIQSKIRSGNCFRFINLIDFIWSLSDMMMDGLSLWEFVNVTPKYNFQGTSNKGMQKKSCFIKSALYDLFLFALRYYLENVKQNHHSAKHVPVLNNLTQAPPWESTFNLFHPKTSTYLHWQSYRVHLFICCFLFKIDVSMYSIIYDARKTAKVSKWT